MDHSALATAFASFQRIISLSEAEKALFGELVESVEYSKKTRVLKVGQVCRYEYFVLKGCLRSYYLDENLVEHTTMFAPEGWWTGNLKSFVREVPSEFFLESLEPVTLIRFSKTTLEALYQQIPKFERYFRILLQNRLLATQDRIHGHLSAPAADRYQAFIKTYPNLTQRIPLKYIASYLGITPTYLSRLRARKD